MTVHQSSYVAMSIAAQGVIHRFILLNHASKFEALKYCQRSFLFSPQSSQSRFVLCNCVIKIWHSTNLRQVRVPCLRFLHVIEPVLHMPRIHVFNVCRIRIQVAQFDSSFKERAKNGWHRNSASMFDEDNYCASELNECSVQRNLRKMNPILLIKLQLARKLK